MGGKNFHNDFFCFFYKFTNPRTQTESFQTKMRLYHRHAFLNEHINNKHKAYSKFKLPASTEKTNVACNSINWKYADGFIHLRWKAQLRQEITKFLHTKTYCLKN